QVEQELLPPQSAAVAAEVAAFIDNAVTRDDDGDAVLTVSGADCPLSGGSTDGAGDVFVGPRFAIGNLQELLPNLLLKRRPGIGKRNAELAQRAGKIAVELILQAVDVFVLAGHQSAAEATTDRSNLRFQSAPVGEFKKADTIVVCAHEQ